jgi:RNA polymerase sigma-70 factor (ECF subfamily)
MGEEMNADMQLVSRAVAGDQDACSEIFCANRDRIYRLCCQILHGPQDAEDLTQETFLTVFGKLEQFRGASRLSTWIYRIAINAFLMQRRKRSPVVCDSVMVKDRGIRASGLTRVLLREAIDSLPDGMRCAFVLRDIWGYQGKEIAGSRRHATSTFRTQASRGRLKMRDYFKEVRPQLTE